MLCLRASRPSLRGANGSRECAPDDRLRDEAIHSAASGEVDCFASLAMTWKHTCLFPRLDCCPSLSNPLSLLRTEGAGNAGCALHPRSRVPKNAHLAHTSIQGSGNTPTSPAQWLYGLLRALPGGAGLLSPSPPRSLLLKSLTPASRHQDHTTWPYASAFSSAREKIALTPKRPSHPQPNVS